MKKTLLTMLTLLCLGAVALRAADEADKAAGASWLEDYAKAKAVAAEKKVPMLLNFTGSDWCRWCIKLDKEVFSQKVFNDYAEKNLVLMKIDFPMKIEQSEEVKAQNKKLSEEFKVRGFPTIYLVGADGQIIGRTGYKAGGAEKYVEHLKDLLKKEQLKKLRPTPTE
ncbi:MAG: thioredoxin family protein [Lentisphaerae bacterium]|jgi:protein disulfide-isomerase|nr:thioredoxin family protein [Lentisphaerota bacterium]